jgi:hypothetical protein
VADQRTSAPAQIALGSAQLPEVETSVAFLITQETADRKATLSISEWAKNLTLQGISWCFIRLPMLSDFHADFNSNCKTAYWLVGVF